MALRWKSNSSDASSEHDPLLSNDEQHHSHYQSSYPHDDLSTGRKTRFGTITSSFMRFKTNNREFLAEFMGTLILVLLICGTSAEEVLGIGVNRSWLTSSLGSGLSVLIAICVAGHVSGGHLNPAVTITFWAFSGFPTKKVPIYFAAQYLGAFCGAAILYTMIEPAISQFDHGERQILGELGTASIFGTYPPLYVGIGSAIASEVIGTALLLLVIMVTGHPNNMPFRTAQGVMIAAGIMTISLGLGYTSGFSINPARDLGPRLFTAIGGWGFEVFSIHHYYALVPMFAPFLGGLLGGLVFTIFID